MKEQSRRQFIRSLFSMMGKITLGSSAVYLVGHVTMKEHGSMMAAGQKMTCSLCAYYCSLNPPPMNDPYWCGCYPPNCY